MRLRCLIGRHDDQPDGELAPPPSWTDCPTIVFRRCTFCLRRDYDMVWPDGAVT